MKQLSVIVVDDNKATLRLTQINLKSMGFEIIFTAKDGKEGFDLISSEKVDLIIADWDMPVMDGMEMLKKIKADKELKDIPFIMQTSQRSQNHIMTALKNGVNGYIVKPYESKVLKEKIDEILKIK